MSKVAICALVVVCIGIGAIAGGVGVYFAQPYIDLKNGELRSAQCVLVSEANSVTGTLEFSQSMGGNIVITGNVTGLKAGKHGFHIHQYGIVRDDCKSAKGHFNPYKTAHGGPMDEEKHVGDMGNIVTETDSRATIINERELHVSLFEPVSIIGRGLVIHQGEDDLKTQPTGDAGGRAACCTIQYVSPDSL